MKCDPASSEKVTVRPIAAICYELPASAFNTSLSQSEPGVTTTAESQYKTVLDIIF